MFEILTSITTSFLASIASNYDGISEARIPWFHLVMTGSTPVGRFHSPSLCYCTGLLLT